MSKISKEEIQESFDKIVESESKEPKISAALEEITGPMKCMIDSTKHMINQNAIYGAGYISFNRRCTIYKYLLEENKDTNQQLIFDTEIIRSLFVRVYTSIDEIFIWINKKEFNAMVSFIRLDEQERSEKISDSARKAFKELQTRYETVEESSSYEFFVERFCLIVILKEIEEYMTEKLKNEKL